MMHLLHTEAAHAVDPAIIKGTLELFKQKPDDHNRFSTLPATKHALAIIATQATRYDQDQNYQHSQRTARFADLKLLQAPSKGSA